jgi:hypothetical protein
MLNPYDHGLLLIDLPADQQESAVSTKMRLPYFKRIC